MTEPTGTAQPTESSAEPPKAFADADLSGARFDRCDLRGAVLRGVDIGGSEIDSPWLFEAGSTLLVNGVDVVPLVDAELNRRFPGRESRRAETPPTLQAAWAAVEQAWAAAVERVAAMPAGTVDVQVGGEWSFAETLRHLVMATDVWLRGAILRIEMPYHPLGKPNAEYYTDGYDPTVFATTTPSFEEVLAVRAERVGLVREFLATATEAELAEPRRNWWNPAVETTTRACLQVILNEEWEHLRFATRDLDTLAATTG